MPHSSPTRSFAVVTALSLLPAAASSAHAQTGDQYTANGWQVQIRRADGHVSATPPARLQTLPPARRAMDQGLITGALPPSPADSGAVQAGIASFYWQGTKTASGEPFDRRAMTAAHRTLPFGTRVRVTHEASGRAVVVRINDRGPFKPGRIIDLSERAAEEIGMTRQGLARVRVDVLGR